MSVTTRAPATGAARRLAAIVAGVAGGTTPVRIRAWDGSEAGPAGGPVLVIRDRAALRRLLWRPNELGLAQAYIAGEIDVDGDVEDGLRQVWEHARSAGLTGGAARAGTRDRLRAAREALRLGVLGPPPAAPDAQAKLGGRLHTRQRDRAAISYHYDLSNEFYQLLLDPRMAYSCACFTTPDMDLAAAQVAKLDLICRKLGLRPGMRMLDVGCGWGALGIHAAREYGVTVVGVTLSREQQAYATAAAGDLPVEFRLQDYRDVTDGPFDAVATVEMGEHVGAGNYPVFAATLHRLLAPTGRLLVQQMSRGAHAPGGGAFIESYVAPDMHMRPVGETVALLERAGLEVRDVHGMREHYVRTVRAWRDTLEQRWEDVVALVGEPVARVWRLYLVGGALTFEEGRMGVDQILAVRRTADGASGMPDVRC